MHNLLTSPDDKKVLHIYLFFLTSDLKFISIPLVQTQVELNLTGRDRREYSFVHRDDSVAAYSFDCSLGDTSMKFGRNILNCLFFHSSRLAT